MWITERAEVYPVVLKLDYKPRRVNYQALREGRTIELMNFFHFDGAEMTLRHLTLFGVSARSLSLFRCREWPGLTSF
jgi:autophagy-related protein 2